MTTITQRSALILSAAILAVTCTQAQAPQGTTYGAAAKPQTSAPAAFDSGKAYEHLRQMVAIGPRPSGSAALKQTRTYITQQLQAIGLTAKEQKFTAKTPGLGTVEMINLIVTLPGTRPDRILLTGHYDTKLIKDSVFVGASDGASTGAFLIELARVLKTRTHDLTYELVWFDGEEATCKGWDDCKDAGNGGPDNTYGSRYYVEAAQKDGSIKTIKAMILVDMIGARDLKVQRDVGMSANWLIDLVWNKAKAMGHANVFLPTDYGVGGDDHEPFWKAGIPSLDIIDLGDYPQWHNQVCCDDLNHVSARSLQIVGDVLLASLPDIEKRLK